MDVRQNAVDLDGDDWERLGRALVTLKHTKPPGSDVSIYDSFVATHQAVTRLEGAQTRDGAHGGPAFLPWHREFLRRFELALQSVEKDVTLPYWNWGLGGLDETSYLFHPDRMGPMGAGGNTALDVSTGYFAATPNGHNPLGWEINQELQSFGTALQRNSTLNTDVRSSFQGEVEWPTTTMVEDVLATSGFQQFRQRLERSPFHDEMHIRVGRDMTQMTSPNDPIFFLHHCQVDRLWAMWQREHPGSANYNPRELGGQGHRLEDYMWPWDADASNTSLTDIQPLLPELPEIDTVRPLDVLDHRAMGYCYDNEDGCPCGDSPELTTLAIGEEGRPEVVTTFVVGEEDPPVRPRTFPVGEDDGPRTDPRVDDPVPFRRRRIPRGAFGDF